MKITLKDGNVIEQPAGVTAMDVAAALSEGLARAACAAKVDGILTDLSAKLESDCSLEIVTFRDDDGRGIYWHTAAHILAQAVKNIYPTVKLAIGPTIKNGFYYDFEFSAPISQDDFAMIEKEMQAIVKADFPIERVAVSKKQAVTQMKGFGETYKLEIIEDLPKGEQISLYKQGNFVDLCRGPHLPSTGRVKFFKLTNLAGAYWRGNENNKMLIRIYGAAFEKKSELAEYLERLEDAKRRDHNKLGRELGYFMTEEKIGQGLPLLMPKGAKLLQILQRFVEDEEEKRGYRLTRTPVMAKSDLYKISGHWDHYRDKMFILGDPEKDAETEVMALRPMTCPFQYYIYKNGLKSYRDLPVRYAETSPLFRNEASGEMHGLIRIRQFTLSDGHIMCTPEQFEKEFKDCLALSYYILDSIGLRDSITFRFSRWDPKDKGKYIDDPASWERAESLMKKILDDMGLSYAEGIGEAAFYGPKLDVQAVNVFGKEDTIITLQADMFLAENFDMTYVDAAGEKKRPYIIHRSSLGCYERTIAMLIEKYAGALPVWFSPEQVRVLSLTERNADYANGIAESLQRLGIRAQSDNRNEKIGYKIREAQMEKVPYMLIVGDKEAEAQAVSVRCRKSGDLGLMSQSDFAAKIKEEIDKKIC